MNKIDLIALDLDGTLLDPSGRVTQASKDAIAQARASGGRVGCSASAWHSRRDFRAPVR